MKPISVLSLVATARSSSWSAPRPFPSTGWFVTSLTLRALFAGRASCRAHPSSAVPNVDAMSIIPISTWLLNSLIVRTHDDL